MKTIISKITIICCSILLVSCLSTEEKKVKAEKEGNAIVGIKAKLLKGAGDALKTDGKEALEAVSEGIGEVIKGVNSGFDKSLNQVKIVSDSTFTNQFKIGRTEKMYEVDSTDHKRLIIYLIAKENFKGKLKLKALNDTNNEIGRSNLDIDIKKNDAKFLEFKFDKRTPLMQANYFEISR